MYRQRLILTALTLLPLAAACGTETGSGSVGSDARDAASSVTGAHWTIDSVTVDGKTHDAPSGAHVEIGENGRVQGNSGCNHFSATATFKGDSIDLGDTSSTEMACDDVPASFETTLTRTLTAGSLKTRVKDQRLTLTTGDGDRVRLSKEQDASLYGTKWRVTALGDKDVAESLPKGADGKAYFVLDEDKGTLSGRFGCNSGTAKATVRDGHITLGTPKTTRVMCDGSLMKAEKSLLSALDGRIDYRLNHRTITLTSTNGETVTAVADK
ncbi:META domain-containing protein [Streptomyces sp. NPDC059786]|uniref:META domain-containing protein n=1 Tax=Streptomyces sp. NPDC059786 TaxID=3346946 RepID=UPI00364FDD39